MTNKKLKIAITGNIGSGKSTFSRFIEEAGYKVIIADELSKSILANDEIVKEKVIKAFGKESYHNGKPNKKFLAQIVFNDNKNLSRLELILHPVVIEKSVEMMELHLKKNDIVFLEAALIYEADMEKYFDYVILITADRELRFQRKKKSENYSEEQFAKREEMQISEDEKRKRADFIFNNNSDLAALRQKVNLLFIILQQPLPNKKL
ncbi:MAG: dephospho-CoA kinase [Ignavibacteriaceae bacterium]|nr:dephospho-CoA kinase [Ignavibacteriaceae bacterium]